MIELSLETLNKKSPYQITIAEDGGYDFITSKGIHYTVYFDDDQPLGGCDTYQFIIQKVEHQRSPHDPKVEQTILTIVDQFFAEHLNVLLYMCDDSDGREANRNRLFLSWFNKFAEPGRFTICAANTVIEGTGFYAAIIVENRNPLLETIIEDFERTAQALTAGKP